MFKWLNFIQELVFMPKWLIFEWKCMLCLWNWLHLVQVQVCDVCSTGYGKKSDIIAAASSNGVNLTASALSYLDGLANGC